MNLKLTLFTFSVILAFAAGVGVVRAALGYGGGYYVNLCGSGTVATTYACEADCDPGTGTCNGSNDGVVKWTCSGKWNQCLESESNWSNREEMGNPGCNKTVQLSVFDKKCRKTDGSWDQSCDLKGFMVWYSGDCGGGGTIPSPTLRSTSTSVTPTFRPTATPRITIAPSPTSVSKFSTTSTATPMPPARICSKRCTNDAACGAGFACVGGLCRNPACPADAGCFCGDVNGIATGSGTTPETGTESWLVLVGLVLAGGLGILMRKTATRFW